MKKIFTLFIAALASITISAEQLCFATLESIDKNNNPTGIAQTDCTMAWSGITSDKDFVVIGDHKYYKFSSDNSYVQLTLFNGDKFEEGDVVTITVAANQEKKVSLAFGSGNKTTEAQVSADVAGEVTRTLEAADIETDGSIKMSRAGNSNLRVCSFTVEREAPSSEPVLRADVQSISFALTASATELSEPVTFSGKNLTPGLYPIVVPDLAGLSVKPSSVSVGEDGKLNATVEITYASEVDVPEGETKVILNIDNLSAEVQILYSADMTKNPICKSLNIEQLVLDNGKSYDIEAALQEANIDYEDINALDSLNDEKPKRNEPYLGLKLKTQAAFVACWVKPGDKVSVKFGYVAEKVITISKYGMNEIEAVDNAIEPLVYTNESEEDEYIAIVTPSEKTVVIKQIMLNEDIAEVTLPDSPQAIDQTKADTKAVKRIVNGQIVIIRGEKTFDLTGAEIQ